MRSLVIKLNSEHICTGIFTKGCEAFFCESGKIYLRLPFHSRPLPYKDLVFQITRTIEFKEYKAFGKNAAFARGTLFFVTSNRKLNFIDCNNPFPKLKQVPRKDILPEVTEVFGIEDVEEVVAMNSRVYTVTNGSVIDLMSNNEEEIQPLYRIDLEMPVTTICPIRRFLIAAVHIKATTLRRNCLVLLDQDLTVITSIEINSLEQTNIGLSTLEPVRHVSASRSSGLNLIVSTKVGKRVSEITCVALFCKRLELIARKQIDTLLSVGDVVLSHGNLYFIGIELLLKVEIRF